MICGTILDRKRTTLLSCIKRFARPGSTIVTDGHRSYHGLPAAGWGHIVVNHSRAFHNFKGVTTNEIEVFWLVLKRTLRSYRQSAKKICGGSWLKLSSPTTGGDAMCRVSTNFWRRSLLSRLRLCQKFVAGSSGLGGVVDSTSLGEISETPPGP